MNIKHLILLFFFIQNCYCQKEFLDYAITNSNDTIYGIIKKNVLFEKNLSPEKDGIKFYSHNLSKMKAIRFNDEIYFAQIKKEDGIYEALPLRDSIDYVWKTIGNFRSKKKKLKDFIVLKNNDTIYGQISSPIFGKQNLIESTNKKIKIDGETVKTYRFNNELFKFMEKEKVNLFDSKNGFLKVLTSGKINLYEYEYSNNNSNQSINNQTKYYFAEKDNHLILLNSFMGNIKNKKKLVEICKDNEPLISQILDDTYELENIYLILKKYNSY